MANHIIFFHGGGSTEDYEADKKLVESLKSNLGPSYLIDYPFLPNDGSPDLGRRRQIGRALSKSEDGVILVAHSLGASMLLVSLTELDIKRRIAGIFLIATPFWEGTDDWVEAFKLQQDFSGKIDMQIPLFFYHCRDDEEVPFKQLSNYQRELPWAAFREIAHGGHQLNNDLGAVARDIESLSE